MANHLKKYISLILHWLINNLQRIASYSEGKNRFDKMQSKFVDLAPTDDADKSDIYYDAITFATNNAKVFNIALTGPYGSGKSSIIQSFLKQYQRPALHISLAAFVPETDSVSEKMSRQEIERSILQQMLYGANANKLPLSRFKRIQSPGVWSIFKSLYIMLGMLSLWYVFDQRENVISSSFFFPFAPSNWFNLGTFTLAATFLWTMLHYFYVASFGLSLKGISLKDVELKPARDDQASILNRHLDEIIYFFQETDYDLVVIEDIDRFENAEIFVTLREINSLVNKNSGINRDIRFLYALRDDMFINTDRTKFFEFIIPVIPIINTSNSIDMVLKQGERLELDQRLDQQFIREVSRYLNDLRLIQNIFNEYTVYVANLEIDGENILDPNKLLAILIYKNVYPKDFELLHRGEGVFAEILKQKDKLIRDSESIYKEKISKIEDQHSAAEKQTPSDLKELRQIYAMALIEMLPPNVSRISLNNGVWIDCQQMVSHEEFEKLLEASHVSYRTPQGHSKQFNISNLQNEVDSNKTYQQRKDEIENNTLEIKNKSLRQIREFKSKITVLRTAKLNELLRLNLESILHIFESFGDNGELARFLLLEGYLDDTYYQFTSLFHSGRLSPNDNKFLIQVRAFVTPEPDFPIDNPKEVIVAMREEDFRQSYVLNVKLVDSLLSDQKLYYKKIQKLFEYLSFEFEKSDDFFDSYYSIGLNVTDLLVGLNKAWKGFIPAAIVSPKKINHITQLIENLPVNSLKTLASDFYELPEFVSANLSEVLEYLPDLVSERLVCLDFEVQDLASIKKHTEIVRVMFEKGLYKLTISNLEFIYKSILGKDNLKPMRERNFSTIRSLNNSALMQRVERDFDLYLTNILLALKENSNEDVSAILTIVQQDKLNIEELGEFLERQVTRLPDLEDLPERLYLMIFKINSIEPTWVNCLDFMRSDVFDKDVLLKYLDKDIIRMAILQHPIPCDLDSLKLRQFLINAGTLSDTSYKEYAHALPNPFKKLPEGLESSKLRILIEEEKIHFTQENLNDLADNRDLQILFVAANINSYLGDPEAFEIDDGFREELLKLDISELSKLGIVELMDLEKLAVLPERSALIGPIVNNANNEVSKVNASVAQSIIINSTETDVQISLFNKYHSLMNDDEVRHVLANLKTPFSDIKVGFKRPRLDNTLINRNLVSWLDTRNIISSWSEGNFFTNDIIVHLYRS